MHRVLQSARRWGLVPLALLVACTGSCGSSGSSGADFAGFTQAPAPDVSTVSLPDAGGSAAPVVFRARPGGLLVAYFGYLSCPDVCPTTLADIGTALKGLKATDRAKVDVVMTTIDPGRDTAAALVAYVQGFVPGAKGARTAEDQQLRAATSAFGADYSVVTKPDGTVEVAHTAYVYLIDEKGRIRLTWAFGVKAPAMRDDLNKLLGMLPASS